MTRPRDELELGLAGLLVEAAHSHDHFDEKERRTIQRLLAGRLNLSAADAGSLFVAGECEADRAAELFHFTQIFNDRLSFPQRIAPSQPPERPPRRAAVRGLPSPAPASDLILGIWGSRRREGRGWEAAYADGVLDEAEDGLLRRIGGLIISQITSAASRASASQSG